MPYNVRMTKRPKDLNQLAATIMKVATEGEPTPPPDTRNPHAVALGRMGGLKGGKARAEKLSENQRHQISVKAAKTRWGTSK
jgi:hypothetical protein